MFILQSDIEWLMKFYDCASAPSSRRVRMFIAEKKIDIPVVEVDLGNREQDSPAFVALNPHRTVPVLELDDGTVFRSTHGICHYLEAIHPEPALMGRDAIERGQIADLDWRIEQDGLQAVGESFRNRSKGFKNHAVTGPHQHAQIPELVDRGRARSEHFMDWLNSCLDGREFVAGDNFTVADITAFITIEFAKWIKLEPLAEYQNLHRWYQSVLERDSAKC